MSDRLQVQLSADPTAEEAAAVIAAIVSLLAADSAPVDQPADQPAEPGSRWSAAARLTAQGLTPTRTPARPSWGTIERIHRAGKGGSGIIGL